MVRALLILTSLLVACGGEADRPAGFLTGSGPSTSTGAGGAAAGGGGTEAVGGSGGAGVGGSETGGGAPVEGPCGASVAFRATGMSFTEPTPPALAASLGAALYGYDAHGISVVVHDAMLSASVTEAGSSGAHGFVGTPAFTDAIFDAGGFRSGEPQASGWLRVQDDEGPVDVALTSLTLDGRASPDCSQLFVVLDAVIASDQGSTSFTFDGQTTTLAEMAGGDGSTQGWLLRALFLGESIDFDFSQVSP